MVGSRAARRPMSGSRRSERGSGSSRVVALLLIALALIGVGFVLGRWTAGGTDSIETGEALAPVDDGAARSSDDVIPARLPSEAAADVAAEVDADDATAQRSLPTELPEAAAGAGPVAIVIDDLGRSVEVIDELRGFGVPLTYAVLPFETRTADVAARLTSLGEEVLCHLPMEPENGENPGPGALTAAMSPEELKAATRKALAAVPGAVGVNNHMGSALSANRKSMTMVLKIVGRHKLFFLDSRTSASSVGFDVAYEAGMPAAERRVFLDRDRDPAAIRGQLYRLFTLANGGGQPAIAIGHPYPETLAVLREEIPLARKKDHRFVRVSELVVRDEAASRTQPVAP